MNLRRLNLFFILILVSQLAAFGQKVSVQADNTAILTVFNSISRQTGYRFSYRSDLIDKNTSITYHAKNENLTEVMQAILPEHLTFSIRKKHIIILSKKNIHADDIDIQENRNKNIIYIEKIKIPDNGALRFVCHTNINKTNEEMKTRIATLLLVSTVSLSSATATDNETNEVKREKKAITATIPEGTPEKVFQLSFIYPLGTSGTASASEVYNTSIGCLGNVTGGINGVEIGGIYNINRYMMKGVQMGGIFNTTNGNVIGLQMAGIANIVNGDVLGSQFSGIVNVANGTVQGIQAAGIGNIATQMESGVQTAGIINIGSGKTNIQAAGITNIGNNANVQLSGITNRGKNVNVQLSGIFNLSKESNVQISGIFNTTGKGGFQLGLINVRDTADGLSIGMLNFIKKGGLFEVEVAGSELIHTTLSLRTGTNRFYSIISLGLNYSDTAFGLGFGFGTNLMFTDKFGLNLELIQYQLLNDKIGWSPYNGLIQFRPLLNYTIAKHFKIFAGPTLNLSIINTEGLINIPYSIFSSGDFSSTRIDSWVGFSAGIRF